MPNNKELDILVKMENLIGYNKNYLFSKEATQPDGFEVTEDDFNSFINYIEKIYITKDRAKRKRKEKKNAV